MLAYVFWHRPREGVPAGEYESALRAFHERLAGEALEGVHGSASFAVDEVPGVGGAGYEDWYYVEASFALDTLNEVALSGPTAAPHDAVAALTGAMSAGIYLEVEGAWRRQMVLGPVPELADPKGRAGCRPLFPGP